MKFKITMLAIILLMASKITAQSASVEKSIYGIQTGILGIWAHNEHGLSKTIALRTEIGFDGGFIIHNNDNIYIMTPVITLEPRWYYNIKKRERKGKNTSNNSANFIGLKTSYHPDWFVISNDDIYTPDQISIIPYWSIKRTIGNHFTYETGFGLGYNYFIYGNNSGITNENGLAAELHLRIGYTF